MSARSRAFLFIASVVACVGLPAQAYHINGYAVSNFRSCGASNLPATIRELERFFGSRHFPADAERNFLWTDARVRQNEWVSANDSFESSETANGRDGADSSLLTYIASHGGTSSARYTAISGGSGSGGCRISTPDLSLGDNHARYLILSTCQGLKIGTGDRPTRPGEDPSVTWREAGRNLNCIFGYSNNMVDGSGYGEYLLANLATSDDPLSEAFFRAARQVHYSNIPAVMCWGTDENDARFHIENDRAFSEDHTGGPVSVWAYRYAARLSGVYDQPAGEAVPRVLKVEPAIKSLAPYERGLLGEKPRNLRLTGDLEGKRSSRGTLILDKQHGVLTWRRDGASYGSEIKLSDDATIEVARKFLERAGFDMSGLVPTYVIDKGTRRGDKKVVTDKMVVLHQTMHGSLPLGTAGSIEVNVNGAGAVTSVTAALLKVEALKGSDWVTIGTATDVMRERTRTALTRLQKAMPEANLSVVDVRFGYDTGSYYEGHTRGRATVEVLIEADQGGFARRFAEKVPL